MSGGTPSASGQCHQWLDFVRGGADLHIGWIDGVRGPQIRSYVISGLLYSMSHAFMSDQITESYNS